MRQIVVAFDTTGSDPKQGARIRDLRAVEVLDGAPTTQVLHLTLAPDSGQSDTSFAEHLEALDTFIGDSSIVVANAGLWRKFLRLELRHMKKRGIRRLLTNTIDVAQWARQRFPRHRKDRDSLARKLDIALPTETIGLARDAAILVAIAVRMDSQSIAAHARPLEAPDSSDPQHPLPASAIRLSLGVRLRSYWKKLIAQA